MGCKASGHALLTLLDGWNFRANQCSKLVEQNLQPGFPDAIAGGIAHVIQGEDSRLIKLIFDKQDPPSIFWTGKILNLFETALDWTVEVLLYILLHINLEDV